MGLFTGGVEMSVKRYDLCKYQNGYAEMESSVDGEWVDYTDYVKLEQQNRELRELLEHLDFCGGLGLDKHRMIKEKLNKYK